MPSRAEELFNQLVNAAAILALIGKTEDVHFDCKEWPSNDDSQQRVFAKAACGLTNAEGGVLVIGMRAKQISKDEPDVVESAQPVQSTTAVKSRILDLIGQLVEPGIEGIQIEEVPESLGAKSGYVVAYIPASDGFPRRSRKDSKFYLRIGSGTFPMEYFQIADMFGQRQRANLKLYFEHLEFGSVFQDPRPYQHLILGLSNVGRGIAKFPSVRFKDQHGLRVSQYGLDGNGNLGLPRRASEKSWIVFRGGVDDVIYPESKLPITKMQRLFASKNPIFEVLDYPEIIFVAEISCEGSRVVTVETVIEKRSLNG